MPPRVTVITATYNWSSVLPYSMGSVIRQTFSDFEMLVVGDGCTDDSESVVRAAGDSRVRWINLPENSKHQSGPNNEGLRQARGEIIAYLGHDDLWFPHHLHEIVAAIDRGSDYVATIGAAILLDGTPTALRTSIPPRSVTPSTFAHKASVTRAIGGWTPYTETREHPETDLVRRMNAARFRFARVPRLTALKFSAGLRKDVYALRPSHEQAEWFARSGSESELEAEILARWLLDGDPSFSVAWRDIATHFTRETLRRLARRAQLLLHGKRPGPQPIDEIRAFKGL